MINNIKKMVLLSVMPLIITGCSMLGTEDDEKKPLVGERIPVLELQKSANSATAQTVKFDIPKQWKNEYWPQAGGYPTHAMQNLELNTAALKKIWTVDIGQGAKDNLPLTAQPVTFGNVIYTLDTNSNVSAFDTKTGQKLWKNSVRPMEMEEDNIGGGLAVTNDAVYATNGYSELIAMNPKQGGILWRTKLASPTRAAPTVIANMVYVITLDNHVTAIDTSNGKKLWSYEGFGETSSLIGASSPAANENIVIAPMSSGEIVALNPLNGGAIWSDTLSASTQMGGAAALPDIAGLPVIDKELLIAASYGGRIAAIDMRSGVRIWERNIGGAKTPWVTGNMIFIITNNAELVAIERASGNIAWAKPLHQYINHKNSRNALLWNGPVMAGDRLIITDSDEGFIEISPINGDLIRTNDVGVHVATTPIVAGGIMYILGNNGTLSAWK